MNETITVYQKTTYQEFLAQCQEQGYSEISTGRGEWKNGQCILSITVCYHPDGWMKTWEMSKNETSARGPRYGSWYANQIDFEAYCHEFSISMKERKSLDDEIANSAT